MKILVNRDFGGFCLSVKAQERLIELGIQFFTSWDEVPRHADYPWIVDNGKGSIDRYSNNFDEHKHRNHPLLIQVVEEIGEEATADRFAVLEIVEIPDGIEWEIYDYDGCETVHEAHREW